MLLHPWVLGGTINASGLLDTFLPPSPSSICHLHCMRFIPSPVWETNASQSSVIIKQSSASSTDIMRFMRSVMWSSVIHNFIIMASYMPGHHNTLLDSLSHFNFQTFRSICPDASSVPTQVLPTQYLALS